MTTRAAFAGAAALAVSLVAPSLLLAQEPTGTSETTTTAETTTAAEGTAPAPADAGQPEAPPATPPDSSPAEPATGRAPVPGASDRDADPSATAAKSGDVTIIDYAFTPATLAISLGDTVTWNNTGAEDHSVTASGGAFDSGTLSPGASFSQTFTQPGTFAYICTFHDEMTGTVIVSAGSTGGGDQSGGSGPRASGGSTTPTTTTPTTGAGTESAGTESPEAAGTATTLPITGQPALPMAFVGAALVALGVALRRRATPHPPLG